MGDDQLLENQIMAHADDVHVPGLSRCDTCGCQVSSNIIYAMTGAIAANRQPPDPCPNGCGAMRLVTWREHADRDSLYGLVIGLFDPARRAAKVLGLSGYQNLAGELNAAVNTKAVEEAVTRVLSLTRAYCFDPHPEEELLERIRAAFRQLDLLHRNKEPR